MSNKVYSYHPDTKSYLGVVEADPDPLDPSRLLVPAYATTVQPPPPPKGGRERFWMGRSWAVRDVQPEAGTPPAEPGPDDPNSFNYWTPDGALVTAAGALPDDAILTPPPATDGYHVAKWEDSQWEVYADFRGFVFYDEHGTRYEITKVGVEPPADAIGSAPPEVGEHEVLIFKDGGWSAAPDHSRDKHWYPDGQEAPALDVGEDLPGDWLSVEPSLDQVKTVLVRRLNAAYAQQLAPMVKDYPEVERLGFSEQRTDAANYLAWAENATAGTPPPEMMVLDAILAGRNGDEGTETLEALARKVMAHAEVFTQAQVLTGRRQRLEKAILSAKTADQARQIKWQ